MYKRPGKFILGADSATAQTGGVQRSGERNLVDHSNYINVLEDYVTRHTQGEIEKGVGGS